MSIRKKSTRLKVAAQVPLTKYTTFSLQSFQHRSLSLDHSSVDCELLREQLEEITLKERCKKSDLKRGRFVDKCKDPLFRHRNNSATKPEEVKPDLPDNLKFRIKLPESSKPVNRRHTVCGIVGLVSTELRMSDVADFLDVVGVEKRVSGEFSFAKNVSSMSTDDWRTKLRLRSSSPDLICFNEFKFSLSQETCSLSFLTSLLESQV